MKHTPGPWIWGPDYDGLYGAGPDNAGRGLVPWRARRPVLSYQPYEGMWLAHPEAEANARLIAAAPEMLDMLKTLAAAGVWPEFSAKLANIIAKAEGK